MFNIKGNKYRLVVKINYDFGNSLTHILQLKYKRALIKLEQILDAKPNTTKADDLELLSLFAIVGLMTNNER